MLKIIGGLFFCLIGVFVVILFVNARRLKPTPVSDPLPPSSAEGDERSVERFQEILRSATVWDAGNPHADHSAFDEFIPKLKRLYPRVFASLELTVVNTYGIMLRWKGENSILDPLVLMAHHDVVEANPKGWEHEPFAAEIAEGKIWARGAVDTKCVLAALFEASDSLLAEGYVPPRDIYLCSSNCEEDREDTAYEMVDLLQSKGITPYMVLDEGGAVIDNPPFGKGHPFALVGVSEKGVFDVAITTCSEGGHASTPSLEDAPAQLVSGLERLQKNPPQPKLSTTTEIMLKEFACCGGWDLKLVFGNMWLFRPLIVKILEGKSETAAMLRSTYALTQLEGSDAANVIPRQAKATVNVRVDPSESVNKVFERIKGYFNEHTQFALKNADDPSPIAPIDDEAFAYLRKVIHSVYPDAGIAPYIQNGASDARHFHRVCPRTYRFAGFLFNEDQRASIHGQNENLDVESFRRGVGFYIELIQNLGTLKA